MGAMAGGGKTNNKQVIRYSSLQVSTSLMDVPVTLFWGQRRLSPNCIDYWNFQSQAVNKGGKGGGKSGQYDYWASVILALCEGPIPYPSPNPMNVWGPSSTITTVALGAGGLGANIFTEGTSSQAPWSYAPTSPVMRQFSYMNTCYVGFEKMGLGESAAVPDYGFELQRLNGFSDTLTAAGWTNPATSVNTPGTDVSFADVIPDFLTNTSYGMGLGSGDIGDVTLFRAYQGAQGLYFSPLLTNQEKATAIIDRWAALANSWIYWDGSQIRFVPLGDAAVSGNGHSYVPDLTPAYALSVANGDFLADRGAAPIEITRKDPADCYNRTRLEFTDRTRSYVSTPYEYKVQYLVDQFGLRDGSSTAASDICNPAVAAVCAQLIGRRAAFIRKTFKFKLGYRYVLLLPGSIVTLTAPNLGLNAFPVRIRTIAEADDLTLAIEAEELPAAIGTYYSQTLPAPQIASTQSQSVDPGAVNTPAVCEPNSLFGTGTPTVLIAASGGQYWGGCNVLASLDGVDFSPIGTITAPALQGTLTAALAGFGGSNPDTADTLAADVTQSRGVYPAATDTLAQNFVTLAYVSAQPVSSGGYEVLSAAGELLAFGAVSATGTYTANLTYLERGLYGTSAAGGQSTGAQFTVFDTSGELGTTLKFPLPANYIGKTVYFKFQSFNVFGQAEEDLSSLTIYSYTTLGAGYGSATAGIPAQPTGVLGTVLSSQVGLAWAANPASDNVTAYAVYRGNGTGTAFASCALIWSGDATSFTDTDVNLVTGYTYYVVAINKIGDSIPSAAFDATTGSTTNGQILQIGGASTIAPGLGEVAVDFNAQVLACNVLEILVSRVVLNNPGDTLIMRVRSAGADITTASYDWEYVQAAYGASPSIGGTAGDTSIHLANALGGALGSDEAFGVIRIQLISGVYPKISFDFAGTYNPSGNKATSWNGAAQFDSNTTTVTGITLKALSNNILSASMAIRGYQI